LLIRSSNGVRVDVEEEFTGDGMFFGASCVAGVDWTSEMVLN